MSICSKKAERIIRIKFKFEGLNGIKEKTL